MSQPHVIVIGGGINGAAIARDAARRGLRVTVFEKNDFGCGTSWSSSKLIHGGLRYLEHFHLNLVRSSLRERNWLLHTYPHNTRWLPFVVPVYRHSPHSRWVLKAGLKLYQYLDSSHNDFDSMDAESLLAHIPGLSSEGLRGGFVYQDGHCLFPERLVLDNLKDAVNHGASIHNHHKVLQFEPSGSRIAAVRVRDELTGTESEHPCDFVVNAAGPWIDGLIGGLGGKSPLSLGVRGSHLVFKNNELQLRHAIYTPARSDGRPFFIIPWLNFVLVGTTEVQEDGSASDTVPSAKEVDYLIKEINYCLPGTHWKREDAILSFSGIRSLIFKPGSSLNALSREMGLYDHTRDGYENILTLIGGKLTTFRETAESVVNRVVTSQSWHAGLCQTYEPLAFGEGSDRYSGLLNEVSLDRLKTLYGGQTKAVVDLIRSDSSLGKRLSEGVPDLAAQVVYAVKEEWAGTVADVLLRRTGAALEPNAGKPAAAEVAAIMQPLLGWDDSRMQAEIQNYKRLVDKTLLSHR